MVSFQNPMALLLIPVVLAALALLIRKNFGMVKKIQARAAFRELVRQRSVILASRSVILVSLVIAIASPFTLETVMKSGDPTLTILVDNSSSMQVLDTSAVARLQEALERRLPVRTRVFSAGSSSAIGNALMSSIDGDDNILLVSDGRNNLGRSFGDMLVLAAGLNATINAVELPVSVDESAVFVSGPRITTNAEENSFDIAVSQIGASRPYRLSVSIDGEGVIDDSYSGSNVVSVSWKFAEGYHVIRAEISIDDHFPQNNVFYKAVKVEKRPDVLFVRRESPPVEGIFNSLYNTVPAVSLAGESIGSYSAVILNDIPASDVDADRLSQYVIDGNGLVVIGGGNSYDRGSYKDSLFEGMLPVRVGRGSEGERADVNIVLVIDISGSTGSGFSEGSSSTVEEVEKALATAVIDDLRKDDKVAVVAFNVDSFIVSDMVSLLGNEDFLKDRISRLVYRDGTRIDEGIKAARRILGPLEGSKNMIIFSDGKSGSYTQDLYDARIASNLGIRIYTVGVGEGTNGAHLKDIADVGNGYYFEPSEAQRLKVIFGESEAQAASNYPLEIVNSHHFVTSGIGVSGRVNGFNQVVPKLNADLLVATQSNNPIITVSRLGLGRIVAITTDGGSAWAGDLFNERNSVVVTRAVNWAVGDLSRNKDFDVDVRDVFLGEEMVVNVVSGSMPSLEGLSFAKVGKRLYSASFTPEEPGLKEFFDATAAVNYGLEFAELGLDPELDEQVAVTGGRVFSSDDVDGIVSKVKQDSRRVVSEPVSYSWVFLLVALLVFLAEIAYRRVREGKANK